MAAVATRRLQNDDYWQFEVRHTFNNGVGSQAGEPKVACPFHKKTFSLQTGACLSGEEYAIETYPIRVEEGKVYVGV